MGFHIDIVKTKAYLKNIKKRNIRPKKKYLKSDAEYCRPGQTTFQKAKIFGEVKGVLEGNSP